MSEAISSNNPKKEFMFALIGVGLFLGLVLLIGISGFLRPAGQHIVAEPIQDAVVVDEAAAVSTEAAAPADAVAMAETTTEEPAAEVAATTAPVTDDAIIATDSGTESADDAVSQAAVADADLTAEQADGDLEATTEDTAAQ